MSCSSHVVARSVLTFGVPFPLRKVQFMRVVKCISQAHWHYYHLWRLYVALFMGAASTKIGKLCMERSLIFHHLRRTARDIKMGQLQSTSIGCASATVLTDTFLNQCVSVLLRFCSHFFTYGFGYSVSDILSTRYLLNHELQDAWNLLQYLGDL